jgi:hypothetical protein
MKAMMKQVVAVKRVGIISTPNQPIYRRFSVEVTQLQNRSHKDALSRRCTVVVIIRLVLLLHDSIEARQNFCLIFNSIHIHLNLPLVLLIDSMACISYTY